MIGNPDFIIDVSKILFNIFQRRYHVTKLDRKTRTIRIHGNIQSKRFLDWIYNNGNIFLKRKHELYIKLRSLKKKQTGKKIEFFDRISNLSIGSFSSYALAAHHFKVSRPTISLWSTKGVPSSKSFYIK
jgi:hypothetical protein